MKKYIKWLDERLDKIFRKEKDENQNDRVEEELEKEPSLEEKIDNSIRKCQQDRNDALDNISQLHRWVNDAIREVYHIPFKFWYNELSEYPTIKELPENNKVSPNLAKKCDMIVEGYRKQIELEESKVRLCDKLIDEYAQTQKKLEQTRNKILRQEHEEESMKALKEHLQRIRRMDEDTSELEDSYDTVSHLDVIKDDLQNIEKDFEIHEEYLRQMNKLNTQYGDSHFSDNTEAYKSEMDKITHQITNKNSNKNKKE